MNTFPSCLKSSFNFLTNIHLCNTSLVSTPKIHIHPLHNIILLRIIRMFLTWNLQNSRNGLIVVLQYMPDVIGNMLIDKNYSNVISLGKI